MAAIRKAICSFLVLASVGAHAATANSLLSQASVFRGYSDNDLQIAKTYSLLVSVGLAGMPIGSITASAYSAGFAGLSDHDLQVLQTYAISQSLVDIYVSPNANSSTYGIQEALNQIPVGGPQWGTNVTGAHIHLAAGDYYITNSLFYSNTFPYSIRMEGAATLATRLIYAGLGTTTNMLTFTGGGNPNGGLNLPSHVEVDHLTLTSITNMQAALLVITNASAEHVHDVNFTDWELATNNLHGPSLSIDGPAPTQAPGNVGLVIGNVNDHQTVVENCFFAGLATGIDNYGDHFKGYNLKSAFIATYGAGLTLGTAWANTSPYSLGAFLLRHGGGLDCDLYSPHFYICNTGVAVDSAVGCDTYIYDPIPESLEHAFAVFNPGVSLAKWIVFYGGIMTDDLGGPGWAITHTPYALSASTALDIRYPVYQKMIANTGFNGNNNSATNFNQINSDTMTATNGYWMPSNAISSWPATPRRAGDCFWGNSNGVIYQLVSKVGSLTWSKTNLIGAAP